MNNLLHIQPEMDTETVKPFLKPIVDQIISIIAQHYSLIVDHEGLHYNLQADFGVSGKLPVSTHESVILDFLGYSYSEYTAGFESADDIIRFITSGSKFCTDSIQSALASNAPGLLAEVENLLTTIAKNFQKSVELTERQKLDMVFEYFPEIRSKYAKLKGKLEMQVVVKEKFNLELIKHVIGTNDTDTANAVTEKVRAKFDNETVFNRAIMNASEGEIRAMIAVVAVESNHPNGSLVDRAAKFAAAAHAFIDQRRKFTNEPYINHPKQVAAMVEAITSDPEMIAAAWLHDVVEDVGVHIPDVMTKITKEFGVGVALLVEELSDVSKPTDGDRIRRKAIDRAHTAKASARSKSIKLADLISNSRSIITHDKAFAKTYIQEKALLLEVLKEGNQSLYKIAEKIVVDYQTEAIMKVL